MNKLESIVYNLVRKNPALKQAVRNIYQGVFDMLPRPKEYFTSPYQYREGFFFGFHDVSPFSEDETKLLANRNAFDLRMPRPEEGLEVGYFDFHQGMIGDFHPLGTSYAWNYHKGCRLQWLDEKRVIYNSALDEQLVAIIQDVKTQERQIIHYPIDAVYTQNGQRWATSFSYERLERCMPGYGYPYPDGGLLDEAAAEKTGLFLVDLERDTVRLLVPLSELAHTVDRSFLNGYLHFVTHTEFSPNGRYIAFLYRRIPVEGDYMKRYTKMMVYDLWDEKLITLPTQESGSHYVWNSRDQIIASCIIDGKSCHVLYDMNDLAHYKIIAGNILNSDGHQSFVSDTSFVTDTYPDRRRMTKLYQVDIQTSEVNLLAKVYSPKNFQTKDFKCHIACDLHPRVSPSGKYVCFDSPRTGKRGLYVMRTLS